MLDDLIYRMIIIMLPQNDWGGEGAPYFLYVLKNIPFCIMGIYIIVFFYNHERGNTNTPFKKLWLAVTLSFAFYVPIFLLKEVVNGIGALMVPKTVMYVWITYMGYKAIMMEDSKSLN